MFVKGIGLYISPNLRICLMPKFHSWSLTTGFINFILLENICAA